MGHPDRLASTIDHPDGGAASCPAQLRKARSVGKWNLEQWMGLDGFRGKCAGNDGFYHEI